MAQNERVRRGLPAAARLRGSRALGRAAVLLGLVAGGWLLGASAAQADMPDAPGASGVEAVVDGAAEQSERLVSSAGKRGPAFEGARPDGSGLSGLRAAVPSEGGSEGRAPVGEAVGGTVQGAVGGVQDTVQRTGGAVGGTVGAVEEQAEGVVSGTVEAGRSVTGGSLAEGDLADAVSGIGSTGSRLQEGLERTVEGAADITERPSDDGSEDPSERSGDRSGNERGEEEDGAERRASSAAAQTPAAPGTARIPAAVPAGSADAGEQGAIGAPGHPRVSGSDSTGGPASPVPAPAAGFLLQQRADTLRPFAHRVDLPGDPTLVVRDAADDPSFSPD
ncbi:hypothetical protein J0910_04575 [Nocardiopsis sp. CNT-189]|uniref:hypothetical protein n=1 Tax=Nocardiopsis oceanisediminis TaxID=2816862 RepID=UPI003B320817